jgi:hypothetical protein
MPLTTLHLIALSPGTTPQTILATLAAEHPTVSVILASQPRHPVIRPQKVDCSPLLTTHWDLLLLLHNTAGLPASLQHTIRAEYSLTVGIPARLLSTYRARNAALLAAAPGAPLTGALAHARRMQKPSAQNLELSAELLGFMDALTAEHGDRPVTMLNLLCFRPGGKAGYKKYGEAFVQVAGKRGGDAKLVGNVVAGGKREGEWWDEVSLVHYPSITHFCDMLAGEDYQEINGKHRLDVSGCLSVSLSLCLCACSGLVNTHTHTLLT